MNEQLTKLCEQFIADRDIIKATFPWDNTYIIHVCALAFVSRSHAVSADTLKECRKLLEQHTSIFSNFRGNTKLPTVTHLACTNDPLETLRESMAIYSTMKEHFYGSEYLAYISAVLTEMISRDRAEEIAVRAKQIFQRMKKEHPFLTGSEDSVFSVLMAFSEKSEDTLISEMEQCYKQLKPHFFDSNAVQTLSHVLVLSDGTPEEKCTKLLSLHGALNKAKLDYGTRHELSVLGSLSLLDVPEETLVQEISQADAFLREQKGYGIFSIDKPTRLMHAVMLVSALHSGNSTAQTSAMTGTLAMVAAQQAAMCAVIASSAAVSAANS